MRPTLRPTRAIVALAIGGLLLIGTAAFGVVATRAGAWREPCAARYAGRIDDLERFATAFLRLTPEQAEAWRELVAALRAATSALDRACADGTLASAGRDVPATLAQVERWLDTGLAAVRAIRPPAEAFYATLSPEQRGTLDELVARRHRH
jgi:hypothetical protein